jgi:SAM-dependent methyltransferase
MPDCDCAGPGNVFTERTAQDELRRYRRDGPDRPTRILLDAIVAEGVDGATLLDVGAGVGVIQLELLGSGVRSAESVDASPAFLAVARDEAGRRGLLDRIAQREGDFVALAETVPPADVVTLVRVVCCYPAMAELVGRSADHARRILGIVYPRDAWWTRAGARLGNLLSRLLRNAFRFYVHPEPEMDRLIRAAGFERRVIERGRIWQVAVYVRQGSATAQP